MPVMRVLKQYKGIWTVFIIMAVALMCDSSFGVLPHDCRRVCAADGSALSGKGSFNLKGSGTAADPWKISSAQDLETVRMAVAEGKTFENEYLRLTADLQLPESWQGLGCLKEGTSSPELGLNIIPFSGSLDGGGHKVSAADGGLPLFNYVRRAGIHDLKIAGSHINGNGLIRYYVSDHGADGSDTPWTARLENITICSGTSIVGSGFISGYSTAYNTVDISHCTVEEGVVIGCNRDREKIGSFGGDFNGTITDCRSAAVVYGTSYVGGIMGCKGNSMSKTTIKNCSFTGHVIAGGLYAGGIAGGGYGGTGWGISSAPNAPLIHILGCSCSGTVEASDVAGGIEGYETTLQAWDNGVGYLRANLFTGIVKTTNGSCRGGIVGAFRGLDRYNYIDHNYYLMDCGADRGIGQVEYVDTSCITHETSLGINYFNTAKEVPVFAGVNDVYHENLRKNHNRTDDPLGADADVLARMVSRDQIKDGSVDRWLGEAIIDGLSSDAESPDQGGASGETESASDSKPGKKKILKGSKCTAGGNRYLVTKAALSGKAGKATLIQAANKKHLIVPSRVRLADGGNYIVTVVGKGAFKAGKIRKVTISSEVKKLASGAFAGSRVVKLVLKTRKLTRSRVKGSLKASKIKMVLVRAAKGRKNKRIIKKYKKWFVRSVAGKKVKVR